MDNCRRSCVIPTLISYFIYKTKFGTIVAEVNRVAGNGIYSVRAARGGFGGGEEEQYYEEEDPNVAPGIPAPAPEAPPMPPPAQ